MKITLQGRYQISGLKSTIEVEEKNRESAIAYLKKHRPTFKIEE